ncbi:hypothetical protein [Pandoraea sp. ISTKB]|uniref:hypothetical protein n=1 Tax=Pandoraea sp. ISTKB TaxID=1586708 RepID=UPI0009F55EE9|nr:hypothetical protein [Pandoraea sp. ISTKB]
MIKLGDVFSIETSKGSAYFQYAIKNSLMGAMIRVLPGIFESPPDSMMSLVGKNTNFYVFFPISGAEKMGIVKKIGNYPIPEHSREMPIFRAGNSNSATKKVENWWLWDGEREWMVGSISDAQRKLPIRQIWNDALLVKRIEDGWLPENDKA